MQKDAPNVPYSALLVQLNDLAQQRCETIDTRLAPLLEHWKKRPALLRRLV